jgi:hypothetical protein
MKTRRRSEFVDVLVITATTLGFSMTGLSKLAGAEPGLMYRAQRGMTPQKRYAHALLGLVINRINEQIRTRTDEIAKLQHYGEALKAAYVKSYGPIEEVPRC